MRVKVRGAGACGEGGGENLVRRRKEENRLLIFFQRRGGWDPRKLFLNPGSITFTFQAFDDVTYFTGRTGKGVSKRTKMGRLTKKAAREHAFNFII